MDCACNSIFFSHNQANSLLPSAFTLPASSRPNCMLPCCCGANAASPLLASVAMRSVKSYSSCFFLFFFFFFFLFFFFHPISVHHALLQQPRARKRDVQISEHHVLAWLFVEKFSRRHEPLRCTQPACYESMHQSLHVSCACSTDASCVMFTGGWELMHRSLSHAHGCVHWTMKKPVRM